MACRAVRMRMWWHCRTTHADTRRESKVTLFDICHDAKSSIAAAQHIRFHISPRSNEQTEWRIADTPCPVSKRTCVPDRTLIEHRRHNAQPPRQPATRGTPPCGVRHHTSPTATDCALAP
eukprot:6315559-Prymnesium_polylepis.1